MSWSSAPILLATLVLTGAVLRPLANAPWPGAITGWPTHSNVRVEGQGLVAGLLGGLRAPLADLFWLRTQMAWEARNLAGTRASLRAVVALDPRPLTFWINGARMLAYDMPDWRLAAARDVGVTDDVRKKIDREQAEMALAWLEEASRFHPDSPAVLIERANIQLNRLHDVSAAAETYREAAGKPGAPPFAARLHAELLRRLGRNPEAYAWLVRLHPTLRVGEDDAAELVLERIRALEAELRVPAAEHYRPPG